MLVPVLFMLLFLSGVSWAEELCPDVTVTDSEEIKLTESEELLLCGDKESQAYQFIPLYQKKFYLTSFLQSRAYLSPTFQIEGEKLMVTVGRQSQVEKVVVKSVDEKNGQELKKGLKRLFRYAPLNPSTLDAMEAESKAAFRRYGYACIRPSASAFIENDQVEMELQNEKKFLFGEVTKEPIEGIRMRALDRFYPFKSSDVFNSRLLTLTEKRMVRSEVIQATYFTDTCLDPEEDFALSQYFILGPPRTIRFGIGASTEVGPMIRFKWSHNRYKDMASRLEASLNASFRNQVLTLRSDQYLWKDHPRRSFFSELTLSRESQKLFEQTSMNFDNMIKWTRDKGGKLYAWSLGPSYEYGFYSTNEVSDTRSFSNIYLKGMFSFFDHDYEFYDINPEEGNALTINAEVRRQSLGFNTDLVRLNTSYTHFHRFFYWGKGSLIGGFKSLLGTSIVDRDFSLARLPPNVKFYAGGSDDIRGFDLKSLPMNSGEGALTRAGGKFELRRTHLFIPSLEAFTFYDLVFLGDQSFNVDQTYWYSVGAGLRWLSPIGLVQTFIANSYKKVPYENLGPYGFIGLGGSF